MATSGAGPLLPPPSQHQQQLEQQRALSLAVLLALLLAAALLEKADEALLPAVYAGAVQGGGNARGGGEMGPAQAHLATFRPLAQALAAPLSVGLVALGHDMLSIVGYGALTWGTATFAAAMASTNWGLALSRAASGVGLALLAPVLQALVALRCPPSLRGLAFGLLQASGQAGVFLGPILVRGLLLEKHPPGSASGASGVAVEADGEVPLGLGMGLGLLHGWRLAFSATALGSILLGGAILALAAFGPAAAPSVDARGTVAKGEEGEQDQPQQNGVTSVASSFAIGDPCSSRSAALPSVPKQRESSAGGAGAKDSTEPASVGREKTTGDCSGTPEIEEEGDSQAMEESEETSLLPAREEPEPRGSGGGSPPWIPWEAPVFGKGTGLSSRGLRAAQAAALKAWTAMVRTCATPTCRLILAQCVIGEAAWSASAFFALWLHWQGYSAEVIASLVAIMAMGTVLGAVLAGATGDLAEAVQLVPQPWAARVICAQLSAGGVVLVSAALCLMLPALLRGWAAAWARATLALLFLALGCLSLWPAPACNLPLLAQVVPPSARVAAYAALMACQQLAAALGAPAVGMLAMRLYSVSPLADSASVAASGDAGLLAATAISLSSFSLDFSPPPPPSPLPAAHSVVAAAAGAGHSAALGRQLNQAAWAPGWGVPERESNRMALGKALFLALGVPYAVNAVLIAAMFWTVARDSRRAEVEEWVERSAAPADRPVASYLDMLLFSPCRPSSEVELQCLRSGAQRASRGSKASVLETIVEEDAEVESPLGTP